MKDTQLFRKLLLLLSLIVLSSYCFAQVTQQWIRRYNGTNNSDDRANALVIDAQGNVYITGGSDRDYTTIKYDANGSQLWAKRYNGPGNGDDEAKSLAVDAQGNVYVTGGSFGDDSFADYATIKYDANGKELWVKRYNGTGNGNDEAVSLAVDPKGNVYVTGGTFSDDYSTDFATIKYDANGIELWVDIVSSAWHDEAAKALAVDAQGNVYVTGEFTSIRTGGNIATYKYDTNGNMVWGNSYYGPGESEDHVQFIAVDALGNSYVTGDSRSDREEALDYDQTTIKYNNNGNRLWVKKYNGPENGNDGGSSLAVDAQGNVYVTGSNTIKYDTNGNQLWVKSPDNFFGRDIAVDAQGNVYVTGGSDSAYTTIKYDTNGNQLWVKKYDGPVNGFDKAESLAIDAQGNVYVTGSSEGSGTGNDYATIKYSQQQEQDVVSFTLMNANTNQAIRELKNGDVINLAALPAGTQLNIRANTSPATVGSVVLNLSGQMTNNRIENGPPYTLFGDQSGDIYGATFQPGNYSLTATPFSAINGGGVKGTSKTIQFQVINQVVNSFTLVNANTEQDIRELKNGDVINLSSLPTGVLLNIRANTSPASVGSVVLNLSGQQSANRTENGAPYTLYGDQSGNYYGSVLQPGNYTLTATPYGAINGGGQKGTSKTISFSVVNTLPITQIQSSLGYNAALETKGKMSATPNPFKGETTIRFSVPQSGYTTLEFIDQRGAVVERLYAAQSIAGQVYTIEYNRKQLKSGVYVLRLVSGKLVQTYKLVFNQ